MGGGFEPEDDGVVEKASGSGDSCGASCGSASGCALSCVFSASGIGINVAHFGHFTRLPAALSGTRILLLQPLHVINNMVAPRKKTCPSREAFRRAEDR